MGRMIRATVVASAAACLALLVQVVEGTLWYQDLCRFTWKAIDTDNNTLYTINLCSSIVSECGQSSAICANKSNKSSFESVGDLSLLKVSGSILEFNTSNKCAESKSKTVQSSIGFLCGKTMGTPEFITVSECVHYFEWRTYVACKKDKFKPHIEVPCYAFDENGKKHDLNPLIKISEAYSVDDLDDDDVDLIINVCRSIDSSKVTCPNGSAACLLTSKGAFEVGRPNQPLQLLDQNRLVLHYESTAEHVPDFCIDYTPAVTITFICPSKRQEGTEPRLTAKRNCRYEIEWETEFACQRNYLESHTCTLTNEQHDIAIDLTPLRQSPESASYRAASKTSDGTIDYYFYLNICGETTAGECVDPEGFVSSCQVKNNGEFTKIAGKYQNQTLRYSDGDLSLIYPGGSTCSSGFQRMTIINFACNESAENDGKGSPMFTGEVDCTYFFDWDTKYACVKEKEDHLCRVADNKKLYDLSPLTRYSDSGLALNWEALDSSVSEKQYFYINVCSRVLKTGGASSCPLDAAACSVDKTNNTKSLGRFLSSPRLDGNKIQLVYSEGDSCHETFKIKTILSLICKPGDLESAPILKSTGSDKCLYEFEWHTSAACVLSKTVGENCRVSDPLAGLFFDLSKLYKKGGKYKISTDVYDFYLNVCGNLSDTVCLNTSGACQVDKSNNSWNLGEYNSKLSYYDGMIKLIYTNGSQYNNKHHTRRSTMMTFLCDHDAGIGLPEYQVEDNYTYNFKWRTVYACPISLPECVVTDKATMEQYDLSSLSRVSINSENWNALDHSEEKVLRKYYINVCRPLNPVPGCDQFAAACEMEFKTSEGRTYETVTVSNLGIAFEGPIVKEKNHILLEYINGSACVSADGNQTFYSTQIFLTCSEGTMFSGPRFLEKRDCVTKFLWETEAACPISTLKGNNETCTVKDPKTGFEFSLLPLASKTGYTATGNGKIFKVNVCGSISDCGLVQGVPAAGCELENNKPVTPVGVERSLQFSTDGILTLTYFGGFDISTGTHNSFIIRFVCDQDAYPGNLTLLREEMSSSRNTVYKVFFEFYTALVCLPAPVDCVVTDPSGNEYDLSDLSRDEEPWTAVDTSSDAKKRTFYLNVCKPLPRASGCQGGSLGSCVKYANSNTNLGYLQSSLQAHADGSLSIVYHNGDKCNTGRFSTRIIFHCDDSPGSPLFQHQDGCEYVFIWRTSEACPVRRAQGNNCQVRDPKSGYLFDLTPLSLEDYVVNTEEYEYHFRVCGPLKTAVCLNKTGVGLEEISSCQVKIKDKNFNKVAGRYTKTITYDDGLIKINYTNGETCHRIYKRSTTIMFYCDHSQTSAKPVFLKETLDCSYLFEFHTSYACRPFKTIECSAKDNEGNSFDLSSLSLHQSNWVIEPLTRDTGKRYYINICKSLVQQNGSWNCSSNSASCLKDGSRYINLGEVAEGVHWDSGFLKLTYENGDNCPSGQRRKTVIRFKCDEEKVDSLPIVTTALEDCVYLFVWHTAAACPLKSNTNNDCRVSNPESGYLFDLNDFAKDGGYTIHDATDKNKVISLNICGAVSKGICSEGTGVCIRNGQNVVNAGKFSKSLTYMDQVLQLVYDGGDPCPRNPTLTHKSILSFVCKSEAGSGDGPVLVASDEETCSHFFSWHTPRVCEQRVNCSVWNRTSIIDLRPLIHKSGYYSAFDDDLDNGNSPDFYINVCQPLNPIPGVKCPPGAAVCLVPVSGPPIDIGRISGPPQINTGINEVYMNFKSNTVCSTNSNKNYSSLIVFHCQRGTELGSPEMVRKSECSYAFQWLTPVVCSDSDSSTGCTLRDEQLQYTFNLTALSAKSYQVTADSRAYHFKICSAVVNNPCNNGAVCLVSGNNVSSFGMAKAMRMSYSHDQDAVVLKYEDGDRCLSGNRMSTIILKCDDSVENGEPLLVSETLGCAVTFEMKTKFACTPTKMLCKVVNKHRTYDLRTLSSMTGPWYFSSNHNGYYLNLCQPVHGGLTDCPTNAAICRKTETGKTQMLGLTHTQQISVQGDTIFVNYSGGESVCGNTPAKTIVQLECGKTIGKPSLHHIDKERCEFWINWQTQAACSVKQQEVQMDMGKITIPGTRTSISMESLYFSLYKASGDIRPNGDAYIYDIQLSGITNSTVSSCIGATVCQVKTGGQQWRRIGSVGSARYYFKDDNLDVQITSMSSCNREKTKMASSTILFHCKPSAGNGIPEFFMETDDCQYLFLWYTSVICSLTSNSSVDDEVFGFSRRTQAVGTVLSLLCLVLIVCLLALLFYKRERRETMMQKISSCCRRGTNVTYKYSKINTDEDVAEDETEWLMEELAMPDSSKLPKESKENGHITTKAVNPDVFSSLHFDELDSEDEVLTVPDVHIHSARLPSQKKQLSSDTRQKRRVAPGRAFQDGSDDDLVGLLGEDVVKNISPKQKETSRPQKKKSVPLNVPSFHDDSDEDLLKV
ncbi:cation-independent mannose-6-phosphate receptor isoform X2 [Erpetoichthys calabaricus]|uniref:cation-independent mannose-6-phosphate receptor isoform X2 n=1 Tax=Erpetoichthys calabaricus TaxID=27687 RepID=UPI0010A00786|nr:cation-independent mannose-6-phosphate receptor isoform X2 [Erpetoichthys calabaricus]